MLDGCGCGADAVCEARPVGHLSLALILEYQKSAIDKRPTGQQKRQHATGSFVTTIAVNAGSAPLFVKAGWRVPNDRFLVLQYEGVWHAPSRPQKLPSELGALGIARAS